MISLFVSLIIATGFITTTRTQVLLSSSSEATYYQLEWLIDVKFAGLEQWIKEYIDVQGARFLYFNQVKANFFQFLQKLLVTYASYLNL